MDASASTSEAADLANAMYWGSDESVNHIADALDLSKGALYALIRPAASGLACPVCGTEVVHSNRTAKDRALVDCPACEWEGPEAEASTMAERAAEATRTAAAARPDRPSARRATAVPRSDGLDELTPPPAPPRVRGPGRAVIGGALLGAAAGMALLFWARRR